MGANQSQDSPFEIDKTNSQIFEVQSGIVWKLRHGIKKVKEMINFFFKMKIK